MTDIKETIQGLYALKTYLASKAIEEHGPARESLIAMQKVLDSAVNLLKEQEALKPFIRHGNWWFQCGKCKAMIDYGDKYCSQCGQEAKWE